MKSSKQAIVGLSRRTVMAGGIAAGLSLWIMPASAAMSRQFHKYRSLWIIVNAIPVEEIYASVFYPGGTYYPTTAGRGVRLNTTILLCGASRKPGAAAKPRPPCQPLGATCEFRLAAGR